jgi:iron-sulfur cluster repair protein YtfE (RIC family)
MATDPRADLPDFLVPFASMHDAMRRDAERLTAFATRVPADDSRGRAAIARWWDHFEATIVGHHSSEDDVVWPAMAAQLPGFAAAMARLVDEHHALDRAMERVRAELAPRVTVTGDPAALAPAAADFARVLEDHLAYEEETVFPRLEHEFPRAEYERVEREIQRRGNLRRAAFELPWVLDDASPTVEAGVAHLVPMPMRVLNTLVWQRRYRRLVAPLLASG